VIGVSIGLPPAVRPKFPVKVVSEADQMLAALSVNSFPTTIVIGPDGTIASYEAGVRSEAALRADLARLSK
jgi:hypothetical protein